MIKSALDIKQGLLKRQTKNLCKRSQEGTVGSA